MGSETRLLILLGTLDIETAFSSVNPNEISVTEDNASIASESAETVEKEAKLKSIAKTNSQAELQLHSDQGFQYASQSYFTLTTQYGITPSMSRRANPYDNAMAENFFSILKSECIRLYKPVTILQAQTLIDDYIAFYNHDRIQLNSKLSPIEKRRLFA